MEGKLTSPPPRSYLHRFLEGTSLYQRAKGSLIYEYYWKIADARIIDDRLSEIEFYRNLLDGFREGDLIFDIGANQGYKAGIFLGLGAKVIAVEPDETSQRVLKQRFLKFRFKRRPLVVVGKAVSDTTSFEEMWIDEPGSAKNTLSRKWAEVLRSDNDRFGHKLSFGQSKFVETITIEDLIKGYGQPLFVKIDVEGNEVSVLRGMRRPVPYLSFEVNLPEFRPEGHESVQILQALAPHGMFNYSFDCRHGLALKEWIGPEEFLEVLSFCTHDSIEVFWRT